jgi:hypothetical protein
MNLPNNCRIIENFIGEDLYDKLDKEIVFNDVYRMGALSPSQISNQCDFLENGAYPIYRHPLDIEPSVYKWSKTVNIIKNKINELYPDIYLNHCLIRKYKDGSSYIREHSDKTIDIKNNTYIFNYSSGAERIMILKNKKTRQNIKINLKSDSLYVMDLKTNEEYYHSIKKQSLIKEPRISLTFRTIDSFKIGAKIYGKGEKYQEFISNELIEEYKKMNHAFI